MSAVADVLSAPERGIGPGWARRALDVLAAGGSLIVLSPLLVLLAAVVRLTSRGPVIFRQERVGQGGRIFTLYKFRSMRAGAPGPDVTIPGDGRVTRVGRFLRATSLDELPQLINVLRGDMTLVGPRPETPALAGRYPDDCRGVFLFRPGLTGPAQLQYRDTHVLSAHTDDPESYYMAVLVPARTAVDLEYLARPSLRRTLGWIVETAAHGLSSSPPAAATVGHAVATSSLEQPQGEPS
jgi:lipopolysaccharide/colanic/teichoic acid biosynthesis glycosyltransferase